MGVTHPGDPAADDAAQVRAEGTLYHLCDAFEGAVGVVPNSVVVVLRKIIRSMENLDQGLQAFEKGAHGTSK